MLLLKKVYAQRKGGARMDIAALSMAMAKNQLNTDFGVAMLSKSLDTSAAMGDSLVAMMDRSMMEQSVAPHLGANIDLTV